MEIKRGMQYYGVPDTFMCLGSGYDIILLQAKALTFGSVLMLAKRTFGALGFSFVRLNLFHEIIENNISSSNEFDWYDIYNLQ